MMNITLFKACLWKINLRRNGSAGKKTTEILAKQSLQSGEATTLMVTDAQYYTNDTAHFQDISPIKQRSNISQTFSRSWLRNLQLLNRFYNWSNHIIN
jgi:hypothetical protein